MEGYYQMGLAEKSLSFSVIGSEYYDIFCNTPKYIIVIFLNIIRVYYKYILKFFS